VAAGEAVFSLPGPSKTRLSKAPKLPRHARWTTLRDHPSENLRNPNGYENGGVVWQAEETETDGRWQRYYGFVGRYDVARVPAEEIEFPATNWQEGAWIPLDGSLFAGLETAAVPRTACYISHEKYGWASPAAPIYSMSTEARFKIVICNRSGADRAPPTFMEGASPPLPPGNVSMRMQMHYCGDVPAFGYSMGLNHTTAMLGNLIGAMWTELPRKSSRPLIAHSGARQMAPLERVDCLQLDLNHLYDVSRPGTYRLTLSLASGKDGAWSKNEHMFVIEK
jgi:hypothetical protein